METAATKDKIKAFEKASKVKVLTAEEQRKKARFNAKFAKFEHGGQNPLHPPPVPLASEKIEYQIHRTIVQTEFHFVFQITSDESSNNSSAAVKNRAKMFTADPVREAEKAEEEKERKESFQRMRSGFELGVVEDQV